MAARAFSPISKIGKWSRKNISSVVFSIQRFIEDGKLDNAYWLPGVGNPADGLTEIESEMGRILETGRSSRVFYVLLKDLPPRNSALYIWYYLLR